MAQAFALYDKIKIWLNGSEWLQTTDCSIKFLGNHAPVKTIQLPLAGRMVGSGEIEATFTNMVRADGFEFRGFINDIKTAKENELTFYVGTETLTLKGWFEDGGLDISTGNPVSQSLSFRGELVDFD